ncbi:MAG: sedoheptulokinase [Gemmataceae bacterium]
MSLVLGLDLGTTTITTVALDLSTRRLLSHASVPNRAQRTVKPPRSEWDAQKIAELACQALRELAPLCHDRKDIVGLGITGQQHGGLVVDEKTLQPLTPFVNWQDKSGEEQAGGSNYLEQCRDRLGEKAPTLTGCRLSPGYLALTLFRWSQRGELPRSGRACFIMDYMTGLLTGQVPFTDGTCAASAGVMDVRRGDWAWDLIERLELPRSLFPEVRPSGVLAGRLTQSMAHATGLPEGLPIYAGIGDNQASFLGSVADPESSILINVGTGGQVAQWIPDFRHALPLDTRPFPVEGFLLVSAGLTGGQAYAVLESFLRDLANQLGVAQVGDLYSMMNRLASEVPPGSEGVQCLPFFSGTRLDPTARASWTGIGSGTFTLGHLARSLLEGMAEVFKSSRDRIVAASGRTPDNLTGSGNGIRSNALLRQILEKSLGMELCLPPHCEEAAVGAARLASVRAGVFPNLRASGELVTR